MKDKICLNCRFYRSSTESARWGSCMYLPPVSDGFPSSKDHDYCGRYEERKEVDLDPKASPVFGLPDKA